MPAGGLFGVSTGYALKARLRQARGDLEGALEENRLAQTGQTGIDPASVTRQILIRLATNDPVEAARLAMPWMNMLSREPVTARLPVVALEEIQAISIRVLLAQGEIERALLLLDQLQATAEPSQRFGRMIEIYLLKALALQKQAEGNITPAALELFERALALAEPEGYVVRFLEEGPAVIPLLQAVAADAARLNHPNTTERLMKYAQKLLDAFPRGKPLATRAILAAPVPSALAEPLTKREFEVLHLMAEGLTYAEVAQRLVVTVNTVRFHVKSIYGKLGVTKRAAAIERARSLGLI